MYSKFLVGLNTCILIASSGKSSICLCWYGGPERLNALQLKKQKIEKHCKIRQNTAEMERKLSKHHETK